MIKNLGASPRGMIRKIIFSFETSLHGIKPSGGINKNRLALQAETEKLYLFFLNLT